MGNGPPLRSADPQGAWFRAGDPVCSWVHHYANITSAWLFVSKAKLSVILTLPWLMLVFCVGWYRVSFAEALRALQPLLVSLDSD